MTGLKVINPGMYTLIQDSGRQGFHNIGITTGGPFDSYSFGWANKLCNNLESAACLEILVGGLVLESTIATQIAITGADVPIKINNQSVDGWCTHNISASDQISIGYATAGCRSYLAVAGGIQCPLIFDSASTVKREQLGGLHKNGQALAQGDLLPCNASQENTTRTVAERYRPQFDSDIAEIRVILGYQHNQFEPDQLNHFFDNDYTISQQSDRMGYRLEGPAIEFSHNNMISEGICLGAIQITTDGQPIILLCDRQTIGGYPKLGSVFSPDIAKLAQLMPGRKICFKTIDLKQAQNLLQQSAQSII